MSATVNTLDQTHRAVYQENLQARSLRAVKVVTGGIVTVKDSGWLLSWTLNRQPQFRDQPKDQLLRLGIRAVLG